MLFQILFLILLLFVLFYGCGGVFLFVFLVGGGGVEGAVGPG